MKKNIDIKRNKQYFKDRIRPQTPGPFHLKIPQNLSKQWGPPKSEEPTLPKTIQENILEKLFYESISISKVNRILLRSDFLRYVSGQRETIESISDYAKVRSIWFALIINPFISKCENVITLFNAVIRGDEYLKELSRNAYQRVLNASDESIRLTDILTLSLSLWCNALNLCSSVIMTKRRARTKEEKSELQIFIQVFEDFSDLIELSEDVVLLASEMKRESEGQLESSIGIDFLMNGLARELCVISLSSILMAYNYLPKFGTEVVNTELLQRIEEIIEVCEDVIDYKIPSASSHQNLESLDLVRTIDSLMKLCEVIWRKFELDNLCFYMSIRRFHFNAVCQKLEPDNYVAYKPLLESISSTLDKRDFLGIIANFTIANCLKSAGELSSHYLYQGSQIALEGDFGDQLKNELSLISITQSSVFKQNLDIFMKNLLKEGSNKTNFMYKFLKSIPEESTPGCVLDFLNASRGSNKNEIKKNTNKTINTVINNIISEEVKQEIKSLLEVFSIEETVSKGEMINFSELLNGWNNQKDLWLYPWVLKLLLSNGYSTDVVRKESLMILDHDPSVDHYNTYLFLALTLSEQLLDSDEIDIAGNIPMSYIKTSINNWKSQLPPETNVRAYRILYQLDAENREDYYSKILKWESIKVHRDHLKRLPDLAKQGKFFLLFRDYFYSMKFWGLRTELTHNELFSHLNIDPENKRNLAYQWKSDGSNIPPPLIMDGGELFVSSKYLYLGSYLFSAPIDQDSNFDNDRLGFNKAAFNSLYDLLDIIIQLPKLPKSIKELLHSHSRRLFDFTKISD